ncbi:TPA: hypothetical protein ACMDN7_002806 [Vibrio parahaemolyticus]
MALTVLKNPIDNFWHDQNLKLTANPLFLSDKGDVYSDCWQFYVKGKLHTLDFSRFDLPNFKLESIATYVKDGHEYSLSSKEYAKLVCQSSLTPKSSSRAFAAYQMMLHLFCFLKESGASRLSASLLESFWTSYMARTVNQSGFVNRVSTPVYHSYIVQVPFHKVRNELAALGVVGVIDSTLTSKQVDKGLDNVCRSQYNTTLAEFKKGESFNFLGLELGQYYVDYLNGVYQQNFLYAAVSKKAFDSTIDKYGLGGFDTRSNTLLFNVMLSVLLNDDVYKPDAHTRGVNYNELKISTEDALYVEYSKRFESVMALKDLSIEALVMELGLSSRSDAMELIRVLMLQKYLGLNGHKTPNEVWQGYLLSLDKTFLESESLDGVSVDNVYEKMQSIIGKRRLEKAQFLVDIKKWTKGQLSISEKTTYRSFRVMVDISFYAMSNLVVAWTGYRKSEFGFPLSAIKPEPNLDILDNAHVPFRFKLKWLVPKTGGTTKINREITSQCYQIAAQLNDVFGYSNNEPCLYFCTGIADKETSDKSESYIDMRVKANWKGFVQTYQPFNDVIALEALIQKEASQLTLNEQEQIKALSSKYTVGSARYKNLLSCAKEVKTDWLRLSNTAFNGAKFNEKFKASLMQFQEGSRVENSEHQEIIDHYLSDETKTLLTSGSVDLNDRKTMRDVISEILEGVRYPSPHAFRHIWAEAVLTRYQGDVGAVIRHQFCHLDGSFFMAYLREKDARGLMVSAKHRYLNSIVERLIIESEQFDEKHSGGFSRFVRRTTQLTRVKTESQIRVLREAIAGRIIDIQPSRFAVCIPRDGGESRAKCAKMGILNPQDAKLEFCLDCINAWVTEGHIRGIWQTIQPMVKEAMQPKGIGFLLEAHLPALTSSWRRIKELRNSRNGNNVDRILSAIEDAIDSIKGKMKVEAELYGYE